MPFVFKAFTRASSAPLYRTLRKEIGIGASPFPKIGYWSQQKAM
jgi:hypothetical protein